MKILGYYFTFAVFFFLSASALGQTTQIPAVHLIRKNLSVASFSELVIQGPVNVNIDATPKNSSSVPALQIFGDPKTVSEVTWKLKDHTLYFGTKWDYSPHPGNLLTIKVNILPSQLQKIQFNSNGRLWGKGLSGSLVLISKGNGCINFCTNNLNLKLLVMDGKANINLHHIKSTHLIIQGKNDGNIKIRGDIGLQAINLTGKGNLMIHWVDSAYLKIRASNAEKIFLAGISKEIDIHLTQKANLSAKQLRANNGFVETQNQAHTEITVKNRLSALANDESTIYYSTPVDFISAYTQGTGLILSH